MLAFFDFHTFAEDAALTNSPILRIVSAAKDLLGRLDDGQQKKVQFAFKDEDQRKRWSSVPTGFSRRR